MELLVARQPIFDRNLHVFGYEILYRSSLTNAFDGSDGDAATAKVINASFYSAVSEDIRGGKPAFINFTRRLIVEEDAFSLSPQAAIVEILETVVPDAEVVGACRRLRASGYKLALDDFVLTPDPSPLTEFADFIKVDFRATSALDRQRIVERYGRRVALVAEKVETPEEFQWASEKGFPYFQGYFFAKPVIRSWEEVPISKVAYLHLLEEIYAPDLDLDKLERVIKREPALAYKLLRFVNSALFSLHERTGSVKHALVYIGCELTRKWLSIIVLTNLAADRPSELVIGTLVRARFCELLAIEANLGQRASDVFLLGLLSRLDAMLGLPLHLLLADLALQDDIRGLLLGESSSRNPVALLWKIVLAYESADWDTALELAPLIDLRAETMASLFNASVTWTSEVARV